MSVYRINAIFFEPSSLCVLRLSGVELRRIHTQDGSNKTVQLDLPLFSATEIVLILSLPMVEVLLSPFACLYLYNIH